MKIIAIFIITTSIFLSSCSFSSPSTSSKPNNSNITISDVMASATLDRYQKGELKEYNGKALDPAIGPRDNSIKGIQTVDINTYSLKIEGLVDNPKTYSYEDVRNMPAVDRLLTLHCVEGWDATLFWKGILMKDLLASSNVKAEAKTIIFHAVDGYTTSLPLKTIIDNNLMMAYDVNNLPLPSSLGFPFIFVAENKWGYKWARWINSIELSADTGYKGYWENLGYDNEADYK